mmetsp:Transcript_27953/g.51634  ORF Transcript_27953/g.51634 Transcript_27953/m.51634 type:complete len:96 (-) Transcript_27953:262-549(-)
MNAASKREPIKGKEIRTLFHKAGYKVHLINNFCTSCSCSACGGELTTFREFDNPRPYHTGSIKKKGLIKCKNCLKLLNRDAGAASNIWRIAVNAI